MQTDKAALGLDRGHIIRKGAGPQAAEPGVKVLISESLYPFGPLLNTGKGAEEGGSLCLAIGRKGTRHWSVLIDPFTPFSHPRRRHRYLYHQCGASSHQFWVNLHSNSNENARFHSGAIWLQSPYFVCCWPGETNWPMFTQLAIKKPPPNLIKINFLQGSGILVGSKNLQGLATQSVFILCDFDPGDYLVVTGQGQMQWSFHLFRNWEWTAWGTRLVWNQGSWS